MKQKTSPGYLMNRNMSLFVLVSLFLIPVFAKAQTFRDKDSTVIVNPRVYCNAGLFYLSATTSLRVDSDRGLGTDISLEDDFKMPSQMSVFKAEATVRIKNRSQFVFLFTSMKRDKEWIIDEDVEFADTTFYIDSKINAYFNTNYYGFTWRYSLFSKPGWNAGFSVGLRALQISAGIDATLNSKSYSRSASVIAPTILFGLHGAGYLTNRLLARYTLEYFQIEIEGIKANVLENRFALEYYIHKNIGIGAGYATSGYLAKEIPFADNFDGKVKFVFGGFQTYLTARF